MFITLEGIEGSGKTSQAALLSEWLNKSGVVNVLTKEPGTNKVETCKKIRALLLDPNSEISNRAEFFLYLADRAEHVEKCIKPALALGQWVISDRYFDSTRVYQGIGRGLGVEEISPMVLFATQNVLPDLTFILDLPVEIGLSRAKKSNKEFVGGDRIEREGIEFHNKLREGFLKISKNNNRYIVLDANKSINDLHNEITAAVRKYIGGGHE
jgi:dTMP kinase